MSLSLLSLPLLIGIAASWAATDLASISNISSGSVKDRVTQLEHIYNAYSQLLTHFQQQLADNQRDIDLLRGQIQENQYQLSKVSERQKQIHQQIDSLSSRTQVLSADGQPRAVDSSSQSASMVVPADNASSSSRDANTEYNEAVALVLKKKQYDQAISIFQDFVKHYPDSTYQPNANYWLGQLNYNKGKKDDAAYYFALVVKKYPKSPKAPDALLKVGVIMQEKGQKDKARIVYQQVGKLYPSANAAKQAQKRLAEL